MSEENDYDWRELENKIEAQLKDPTFDELMRQARESVKPWERFVSQLQQIPPMPSQPRI